MAMSKLLGRLGRSLLPPECLGPHHVNVDGHTPAPAGRGPVVRARVQEAGPHHRGASGPNGPPPLALVLGWAGASDRNLAKYADIYLRQGCTTAHLTLPSSHVFNKTREVPEVMGEVVQQLEEVGVWERPLVVHCLSDTGAMAYQGLTLATGSALDVRGVVWDSCPGPRPKITVPRVTALLIVNWFCARQDGLSRGGALHSSYRLLLERGGPNLLRRLQGKEVLLSQMDGVWAGYFGRDHYHTHPSPAELFLYSNADFYLPHKYLETQVLDKRRRDGARFSATRFHGSAHVQHYRKHPEQYEAAVSTFLRRTWAGLEQEEEEEVKRVKQMPRFAELQSSFGV